MPVEPLLARCLLFYSVRLPNHRGKWLVVDRLRRALRLNLKGEYLVERQRSKWLLDPSDFPHHELFWLGVYDEWQMHHILKLIRPDDVFFDIGSNLGYYSITLGSKLPGATVRAFEPNPPTFARLRKHIELNRISNVCAHPVALSDQEGTASLTQKPGNSGRTELVSGSGVRVTTLDRFCQEHRLERVDVLKIDVEGFERRVLTGAAETIRRHKPHMIIEAHPMPLIRAGSNMDDLMKTLANYGYLLFEARRKKLVAVKDVPENDDVVTWFCFHRDRLPDECRSAIQA